MHLGMHTEVRLSRRSRGVGGALATVSRERDGLVRGQWPTKASANMIVALGNDLASLGNNCTVAITHSTALSLLGGCVAHLIRAVAGHGGTKFRPNYQSESFSVIVSFSSASLELSTIASLGAVPRCTGFFLGIFRDSDVDGVAVRFLCVVDEGVTVLRLSSSML